MLADARWEFWIDRGGTFTDCIGLAPDGSLHVAKLLSSEEAPLLGMRRILEAAGVIAAGTRFPRCGVKLGTTVATNALLERRGVSTLLLANRGLADVFRIGTQERPELFNLEIQTTPPVFKASLEIATRVGVDGVEVDAFDEAELRAKFEEAKKSGIESVAVALIHSYAYPQHEARAVAIARELGFSYVVSSSEIADEMGLLARGETAIVDAYLTPLLRAHVKQLEAALPGSSLRFMQSSGGLTDGTRFRGPSALLSGPAGGVVGAAKVATAAGFQGAIGFDMGGTSTDVSLIVAGEVDRAFESIVGGVRVKSPMLRIHTVAAGGGSLCRFNGFHLTVGPESAGAEPGPLCYGLGDENGNPLARELAITDVNFFLGRVQTDRFPFDLERDPVRRALETLQAELAAAGHAYSLDELAAGFVEVANASMAQAIQQVSVARGVDPRDHVLVGFGGAGGQHVCAVARVLGMRQVLLHPLAGLLSAYGIGVADESWDGQRDAGRMELARDTKRIPEVLAENFAELEAEGRQALCSEGAQAGAIRIERSLDLRYVGTESALSIAKPEDGDFARAFDLEHQARFGYLREGRAIEVTTLRVRARVAGSTPAFESPPQASRDASTSPQALRHESIYFKGLGRIEAPVYERESLHVGDVLQGPALILEDTSTVVLEPEFRLEVIAGAVFLLTDEAVAETAVEPRDRRESELAPDSLAPDSLPPDPLPPDPVRLEVFGNRFMSIAEQMGAVLRNTAVSANIKERLDYSCAVFDAAGGLVANAPHIPVHLGAMGVTVRAVMRDFPDLAPGDAVVTNDPFRGGSHLPDVTVVTPVFVEAAQRPSFFVASRGHHADLGGTTPGSMPADSRSIEEEGVLIEAFRFVSGGEFHEARLRSCLTSARHPARNPDDNVADLEAAVAANRAGEHLLREMVREVGANAVSVTMRQLQEAAAGYVAKEIAKLPDGEVDFEDQLDDGTPLRVCLTISGEAMEIDFSGSGDALEGNLNAPRAVVNAAVIYVLRCLVNARIPLNGGCLAPVTIVIPEGSLLDPPAGSAVVGGNVETSQRLVDVLLGALGRVAASQGTMNNVAFGDAHFGYYETIGGGSGAGDGFEGASGVHSHMTNTRITDPEVLEARYPVRLCRFELRTGSGGTGKWRGGDGLVRCYEFLSPVTVTLLTQRRTTAPYGMSGGEPGRPGRNAIERVSGELEELSGTARVELCVGDQLVVKTPGGGGYGKCGEN